MKINRVEPFNFHCYDRIANKDVSVIVLHHTATSTYAPVKRWFTTQQPPGYNVSAHYVIDRDGQIYQFVGLAKAAWHAGTSVYRSRYSVNMFSIGIELVNLGDGKMSYPVAQVEACAELCRILVHTYPRVTVRDIVGHKDICLPKGRKIDPAGFPWQAFRAYVEGRQAPHEVPEKPTRPAWLKRFGGWLRLGKKLLSWKH